jgi:lipid II:glycine glycyltransferase (peptidoglycan interpeptide bridge formation enzyme)
MSHPSFAEMNEWDQSLAKLNGHMLQSFRWGEFKSMHGWSVQRVAVGGTPPKAMAQILFRRKGPVSVGYIPRGPSWNGDPEAIDLLFREIDRVCRSERAIMVIVESDKAMPATFLEQAKNHVPGPEHVQPARTVKIPLLDDEPLLDQMRSKTRANIRQALRRGTTIIQAKGADDPLFDDFYGMLTETSDRNAFGVHSRNYYSDFLEVMRNEAALFLAQIEGQSVAAIITGAFGNESIYFYGASSTALRTGGSTAALQFGAMKWGRSQGASWYDLWGIPLDSPELNPAQPVRSVGENMAGLFRFKTGFGGEIVSYPLTIQRNYSRLGSYLADRFVMARNAE